MSPPSSQAALHAALARAARELAQIMPQIQKVMADIGRAARASNHASGAVFDVFRRPVPEAYEDPRERALWARRNRNTGPAHDPFTHRGTHDQRPHPRSRGHQQRKPTRRIPPGTP